MREKKARFAKPTVSGPAADYIEQYAKVKKREKSVYGGKRMLNNIILPKIGKLRVLAVTKRNVESLQPAQFVLGFEPFRRLPACIVSSAARSKLH